MELNHQIRLCRPFPFRFGFRAVSHNTGIVTVMVKALQNYDCSRQANRVTANYDSPCSIHRVPPPKESMKENRGESKLVQSIRCNPKSMHDT
jgi:hypothetical protein